MRNNRPIIKYLCMCCAIGLVANSGCGIFLVFFPPMSQAPLSAAITADFYQLYRSPGLANQTAIRVMPIGGAAPYYYEWSVTRPDGNSDNERLSSLDQPIVNFTIGEIDGPYRLLCVIRDAHGNNFLASVVIRVGSDVGLDINTERLGVIAGGGPYGQATIRLTPRSGTPPFTVTWVCTAPDGRIDNDRLDTSDPLAPRFTSSNQVGTYILTATIVDALGATATQSVIVVVGQTLGADVVADRLTALPGGGNAGIIRLLATAIGGSEPYEYQWEVIGPNGNNRSGLLWDTKIRNPIFESDNETGTYIIRCAITDSSGTVLIGSTTITVGQTISLNITTDRLVIPVGVGSGQQATLRADVRGGQGAVSLRWDVDGPNNQDYSNLLSSQNGTSTTFSSPDMPGSYVIRCTATDENGMSAGDSLTISAGGTLGVVVSTSNQSPAVGGAVPLGTAMLSARVYGGVPPYTYSWTVRNAAGLYEPVRLNDASSPTPLFTSSSQAGQYSVTCTVTDAAGASAADAVVLNVGQPLNVDASIDKQTLTGGGGVSGQAQLITVVHGGVAPYGYSWSVIDPNQNADPGRLSDLYIANPIFTSALTVGTYRLTLNTTDTMGVVFVDTVEVVVTSTGGGAAGQNLSASVSIDKQNIGSGGNTATAHVLSTGGVSPLTFAWSVTNPAGDSEPGRLNSTTSDTVVFTSSGTQGTYRLRCTVSDSVGSTFTDSVQLTVSDRFLLNLSASQTHLAPGGVVELLADRSGGSSPFTYTWSCVNAGGTPSGTFSLGATGTGSALTASVNDYTNTWTAPAGAGSMGAYRITVTAIDSQGNTYSSNITVTVNDSLLADLTAAKVYVTPGQSTNLSIHLTGGSPSFTYNLTSRNASDALAGTFTTGSTGTGSATLSAVGDATNTWTAPAAGLGVLGTYRITALVTDSNGNSFTDTVSVVVYDQFSLNVTATDWSIAPSGTTTLTANRTGGQRNFTFTWTARNSGGAYAGSFTTGATATGRATQSNRTDDTSNVWTAPAAADTYVITCVATDALGHSFTDSTEIVVGSANPLAVNLNAGNVYLSPGNIINLSAVHAGGTANFNYTWSVLNSSNAPAGTLGTATQTNLAGDATNTWTAPAAAAGTLGTYRILVTITDALSQQASDIMHVIVTSPVSLDLRANDAIVSPLSLVALTAGPNGGEATYDYTWQAIDSTGVNAGTFTVGAGSAGTAVQLDMAGAATNSWSVAGAGRYTIICTVTDNIGQSFTDSIQVTVTEEHILLLDVLADRSTAAPGETVNLIADRTGGTANFNYSWSVLDESGASAGTLGAVTQNGLANDAANTWTAPIGASANGTYRIICTLMDAGGRTFVDSTVVQVTSLAIQNIFFAPAAATLMLADTGLNNDAKNADPGLQFFPADGLLSPDLPRNVVITIHDQNTSINGGMARVTGLDPRGFSQSEVITITATQGADTTYTGVKPFATVTQVDLFGFAGTINMFGQVDTVRINAGNKFGLTGLIRDAQDVVYVYEGSSILTSGYTVDSTFGQQGITFASVPNGARNYIVVFRAR